MKTYLIAFQFPNFVYQALTIQVSAECSLTAMYKAVDWLLANDIKASVYKIKPI